MHERFGHISTEEWLRRNPDGNKRASYIPGLDQSVVIVPVTERPLQAGISVNGGEEEAFDLSQALEMEEK